VSRHLAEAGVDGAERESAWLIEAATGRPWHRLDPRGDVGPDEERRVLELARRRASGEPIQYLTGLAGFRALELKVGPGVFIPRPETELVAEWALSVLPHHGTAVDVGTGSGAIALALARERPDARVLATEASERALWWAHLNRRRLHLPVELFCGDLLTPLPVSLEKSIDVVVANPPYISPEDAGTLPPDVVEHEPHRALFAGARGTAVLRRLARSAPRWLRSGGWLVLEIGAGQGDFAAALLSDQGYADCVVRSDLAGRARIAMGRAR
jgi:release factor glutamine methyltransferase